MKNSFIRRSFSAGRTRLLNYILILAFSGLFQLTKAQAPVPNSLDSFILNSMSNHHIAGLAATIIKDGKIAWSKGYGLADIDKNIPFTPNTINAEIASVSKTITATALMQLWEQGDFQLDDPINNYLPFPVSNPYFPDIPITFRMLLNHTSSINDDDLNFSPFLFPGTAEPLGDFLSSILVPGGEFYADSTSYYNYQPGTQWNYSDYGFALIGYLVELISGIPFDQYCNQNIFEPLCMNYTGWHFSDVDSNAVSRPYTYDDGIGNWVDDGLYEYSDYPDGLLKTNVVDLSKFLLMNMNNGILDGIRILDSSTLALMRTIQPEDSTYDHSFQDGLGWFYWNVNNEEWWGHNGDDLGIATNMLFNITDNTGIIILKNSEDDYSVCWDSDDIKCELFDVADTISTSSLSDLNCSYISTPCERGKNYWKNNPEKWALNSLPMKLGTDNFYDQTQVLSLLNHSINGNASTVLAKQLISAKLNIAQGSELSPIIKTVNAANESIANRILPILPRITLNSYEGMQMLAYADTLYHYNHALLNSGSCSDPLRESVDEASILEDQTLIGYPNPFSQSTTISFSLSPAQNVSLQIYDVTGRLVKTLVDDQISDGNHQVQWNATDENGNTVSDGIYLLKMTTSNSFETSRLSVMK